MQAQTLQYIICVEELSISIAYIYTLYTAVSLILMVIGMNIHVYM